MIPVTGILLKLPDGRISLQRRTKDAPAAPGMLGFFGGHIEKNESPLDAAVRELKEETTLRDNLDLKMLGKFRLEEWGNKLFHIYKVSIPSANFKVLEGAAAESYSKDELLKREDITDSLRLALKLFGDK